MSKCVVHMMKMKMSAMGGIQSHNQREHESKKNKEIDYERSKNNYDVVLSKNINYQKAVKSRIEELNLKKAVRKDAVVYCSFIVSSDKGFFERLGQQYLDKVGSEHDGWTLKDYEIACPEDYNRYIKEGSREFFEQATEFFRERYGAENVINATVHLDENTPHLHIGIVPATKDNRLSAKEIFTPTELKQLQTEFAKQVGTEFDLERGKEGSQVKHLDELTFKAKKRQEEVDKLEEKARELNFKQKKQMQELEELKKQKNSLLKAVSDAKVEISTLEEKKTNLGLFLTKLELYKESLSKIVDELMARMFKNGHSRETLEQEIKKENALKFIEQTDRMQEFEEFCTVPRKFGFKPKESAFDTTKTKIGAKKNDLSR